MPIVIEIHSFNLCIIIKRDCILVQTYNNKKLQNTKCTDHVILACAGNGILDVLQRLVHIAGQVWIAILETMVHADLTRRRNLLEDNPAVGRNNLFAISTLIKIYINIFVKIRCNSEIFGKIVSNVTNPIFCDFDLGA